MPKLAIINTITNICENVSSDPRPVDRIILPYPYKAINLEIAPAIDWVFDENTNEYIAAEGLGNGGIGDIWDGEKLVQPKPSINPI